MRNWIKTAERELTGQVPGKTAFMKESELTYNAFSKMRSDHCMFMGTSFLNIVFTAATSEMIEISAAGGNDRQGRRGRRQRLECNKPV